jgi:hypothetical protein
MSTDAAKVLKNANKVTANFALYFSLDDRHRRTDAPSFLALITESNIVTLVIEVLKIVGQHVVERATDGALDRLLEGARALKSRLTSQVRDDKAGRREGSAASAPTSAETLALVELMTKALEASSPDEITHALKEGEIAVRTEVRAELRAPESKAAEYAVALVREIRITLNNR